MIIDMDALKQDLKNELLGAFYGGDFGGALIESFQIDKMEDEKIIELALQYGLKLENYQIEDRQRRR